MKSATFPLVIVSMLIISALLSGCNKESNANNASSSQPPAVDFGANLNLSPGSTLSTVDALLTGADSNTPCAIKDGKVKCWGENNFGRLGLGDEIPRGITSGQMGSALPEINLGTDVFVTSLVGANGANRCALLSDGRVKCWGLNTGGELGLGDISPRVSPMEMGDNLPAVNLGTGRTAKQISAGGRSYCALLDTNQVKCWGEFTGSLAHDFSNPGFIGDQPSDMGDNLPIIALPTGRTAKKVSVGAIGACAILDNDGLFCWNKRCKKNNWGAGFTCSDMTAPSYYPLGLIPVGEDVADVGVGTVSVCVLLKSGQVRCWGHNTLGSLGQGSLNNLAISNKAEIAGIPTVDLGTGRSVVKISVGAHQVCAILDNGELKCWGLNYFAHLGLEDDLDRGSEPGQMGDYLPAVNLGTGRKAVEVSIGSTHTCAVLDDGTVKCWGRNERGELGQGDNLYRGHLPNTMGDNLLPIDLW